jgi:hypothetical protein
MITYKSNLAAGLVFTVFILGCVHGTISTSYDQQPHYFYDMSKHFGNTMHFDESNEGYRFEYCPDNTCESLRTQDKSNKLEFQDFAFLYIFYLSSYNYDELKNFRDNVKDTVQSEFVQKKLYGCIQKGEVDKAKCLIQTIAEQNGIIIEFVRYDENSKAVVKKDVSAEIMNLEVR